MMFNYRVGILAGIFGVTLGVHAAITVRDRHEAACGFSVSYNPVFKTDDKGRQIFTADPAVIVDGDTLYVYAGQDEAAIGGWFAMNRWVCYSTKDMVTWTYEGVVLEASDISWGTPGTAWACDVVKRNGKYYFYSTTGRPDRKGLTVGVMVSDSPTGPFVDVKGEPLFDNAITTGGPVDGMEDIDPTVFVDDDGQAYAYWGNGKLHYALLNDDMMSLKDLNGDGEITEGDDVFTDVRIADMTGSYGEAPWLYKANGQYYLVYASDMPQFVRYAVSDSPRGPWTYGGTIVGRNVTPDGGNGDYNAGTCHPAVIEFKGQSYVLFHNAALPTGGQCRRSVCIEKMFYNDDGTIRFVPTTSTGLTGKAVRIQPWKSGRFVAHAGYDITLSDQPADDPSTAWELVAGLADGAAAETVSIQAVHQPGYYLTVDGGRAVLAKHDGSADFKTHATFKKERGLANKNGVSFRSLAEPTRYLNCQNDRLSVAAVKNRQDATFAIQEKTWRFPIRSSNDEK